MYNTVLDAFDKIKMLRNDEEENQKETILLNEIEKNHEIVVSLFEEGLVDDITPTINTRIKPKYHELKAHLMKIKDLLAIGVNPAKNFFQEFENAQLMNTFDGKIAHEVRTYWKKYLDVDVDPSLHLAFYNLTGRVEPRLVTQLFLNTEILPVLNKLIFGGFYSDKNVYDILIDAKSRPKTFLKRVNGQYFDEKNFELSRTQAYQQLAMVKRDMIIKQSLSDDGKSVEKLRYKNRGLYYKDKKMDLIEIGKEYGSDFLIQDVIKQHPMMAAPHKYSVNTFRMVTLRWNNDIQYLMTYARFGSNKEVKDNGGEGGIVIAVSPEGKFSNFGMEHNGTIHHSHPTTGYKFSDFPQVPNFDEFIEFVKTYHRRIIHHNYVSWDIAMGEDGKPIFIEMNFKGPVWKYQLVTERAIFGEFTEEILAKVLIEKKKKDKIPKKLDKGSQKT